MPDIVGLNRIFENKQLAIESFGTLDERQVNRYDDGKQVLARYYNEEGNVASLVGIYHYKRTEDGVDYGNVEVKDYSMNDVEYITSIIERVRDIEETIEANTERIDALRARLILCCGEPPVPPPGPDPSANYLTFTNEGENQTYVSYEFMRAQERPELTAPEFFYSLDNAQTWSPWEKTETENYGMVFYNYSQIVLEPGESVKLYGDNMNGLNGWDRSSFVLGDTEPVSCSGNVMTLLHWTEPEEIPVEGCFLGLFTNCTKMTTAPELPSLSLTESCYSSMFNSCTSLTEMPELPATELPRYCYNGMFAGCDGLVSARTFETESTVLSDDCCSYMFQNCRNLLSTPELPCTELAKNCYAGMFDGCTSLTVENISELPATTLAEGCYKAMFQHCTSLTDIPELPAMQLEKTCYQLMFAYCNGLVELRSDCLPATGMAEDCYHGMFSSCTSLTTADVTLPAQTMAKGCYMQMFLNCTSLVQIPELPAITLAVNCYSSMFNNCTSLVYAFSELPGEILEQSCYETMFFNCTSLQTAPEILGTTARSSCCRNMFSRCSSLVTGPSKLYSLTLDNECYAYMFHYCTSLTAAPELPAPVLAYRSYYYMFYWCTSLEYIKCLATDFSATSCLEYWVFNVGGTNNPPYGTFVIEPGVEWPLAGNNNRFAGYPLRWSIIDNE